jgi:FemAB-related protein (PEP-CTERM system-associated)
VTRVQSLSVATDPGARTVVREWSDPTTWDAFVSNAPDSTVAHRWAWLSLVRRTYRHSAYALAALRGETVTGVLPLVLMRSRVFGTRLVSMPYLDCAGICSAGDEAAEAALLAAATELASRLRAPLELRQRSERPYLMPASLHKVALTLELDGGEAALWKRIKPNRRSQVRKAERHGLTCEVGGVELVPSFFNVLARNMRDLGSPVHRRSFFTETMVGLGGDARILLVRKGNNVLAGALLLGSRDTLLMPFSSAVRESFSLGTNQLLYWESIRLAVSEGYRVLDLGRSSPGSGTFEAKREWGATAVQLHWYGSEPGRGELSPAGARAVASWKHLPVPVATAGGHLVRGWLPQ